MPVTETYIGKDEAERRYNMERLPDDAGDQIRIIKIGDYDECPCIGPHVSSTKEIGEFKISSSSFEKGVLRIRYKLHG
jgi:Ser-tRNA(Ala) deacylase AlaX